MLKPISIVSATGVPSVTTTYDSLQRATDTSTLNFAGGEVRTATAFDKLGRKKWSKRPIAGADGVETFIVQQIVYDVLNRPQTEYTLRPGVDATFAEPVAADWITKNAMSYSTSNRADRHGKTAMRSALTTIREFRTALNSATQTAIQSETKYTNEDGKTIEIVDAEGQATYFKHDALGNLTRTDSPLNIGTTLSTYIQYDRAGRKTKMLDPNSGTGDGSFAATDKHHIYTYFGTGQISTQTDSAGRVTSFTYDKLDRPLTRTEPYGDGTNLDTAYTYDTCAFGKGKLCKVTTNKKGYSREHQYDSAGRPTVTRTSVDGEMYASATTYDSFSRPAQLAYPSRVGAVKPLMLTNTYNPRGFLTNINGNFESNKEYFRVDSRYNDGAVRQYVTGGVTHKKDYDLLGRIKAISASQSASNIIQAGTYAFDGLGNLRNRSDAAAGLPEETFSYDGLNRVTGVTRSGVTRAYDYSPGGNLIFKGDLVDMACGGSAPTTIDYGAVGRTAANGFAGPHAVRSACGRNYSYDLTGNLTSDGGLRTYNQYTAFNLPLQVQGNNNSLSYSYDADHQRLLETVTGSTGAAAQTSGTTTYIGQGFFEAFQPNGQLRPTRYKHYIGSPEGIAAVVTFDHQSNADAPSTTRYWAKDNLGSIVAEYADAGSAIERYSYDVWGKRRNVNGTAMAGAFDIPANALDGKANRGFTGHEMLDEVGLIHMNGRMYDPMIGRFVQADPIIQEPYMSQSYNRYSYVINNPLSLTDPSGFTWWTKWRAPIFALAAMLIVPQAVEFIITEMALAGSVGAANLLNTFAYVNIGAEVAITNAAALGIVAGGMAGGAISGGSFESAIIGAFKAAASLGIGNLFDAHGAAPASLLGKVGHTGAHAAVGCATTAAAGGSCKAGAMAQGFSALAGHIPGFDKTDLAGKMVVGAIASKLGGGDYASGALSAAFEQLYNNGAGGFDVLPNKGVYASYSLEARLQGAVFDPRPHGLEPGQFSGGAVQKTPAPTNYAKVFFEQGVKIGKQVVAQVGDQVYKYNFGRDSLGRDSFHFSSIENVKQFQNTKPGMSKALALSEKTVEMQRLHQLTQPVNSGANRSAVIAEGLKKGSKN